jgi:predicted  nucleic acid-binding Zn-ribbon protein
MASGAIKGITIEFKGDTTQLGKALSDVNKEIRTTDSALREVDKALKLDPTNVELLAQKEELLNKQIEQTKDKLELQKVAAKEAAEALAEGTITKEEYAKLTAEVSTTASKLQELEGKASDTSAQLKDTGNAAQEAGEKVSSSSVNWEAFASAASSAAEVAWEAIKAVGEVIAEVTSAMIDMSVEAANYADDMLTMSTTTGVAVDTLQALQYGEDLLDTSIGTVSGSITKLIKAMGNAQGAEQDWQDQVDELNEALANGTMSSEEYADAISDLGTSGTAFSELGINILDAQGNLRDSEEVFWEVIDALGEIENVSERDTAAMELFGRSAMQLNSLIEAGSEGFHEIYNEAEAAGAIMDGDALDAFHNFDDTLSRLDQGTQAARRAIGSILLPVLDELAGEGVTLLNDFTNGILDANGDIDQMGVVIENAVNTINEILQGDLVNNIIELGGSIILTLATALLDNLDSILSAGITLIMTVAQGIVDNLSSLAPVAADLVLNLVNFVIQNLPTVIDAAVQIIVAIVDGISRALPELIPAAVACVEQVITALIDNLDLLIPAALELILALAMGIVAAIPQLIAVIPQLVESIANEIVDLADSLADAAMTWGVDLIQGFIDGIWNSMGNLVSSLESVASTIAEYLGFSVPEKGPLHEWAYNNPGSDMIDLFTEGMENEDIALQRALYGTSNVIYNGMTSPDYSGALSGISSQLAGLGGGGNSVINVYLGSQRVGSVVTNALDTEYYLQGGT